MHLTFAQMVEELQNRPADELGELADIARRYAIEKRREDILKNAVQSKEEWEKGELKASDNIDDLMQSLNDV